MNTIEQLKKIGATFHISAAGGGTITISNTCSVSGRSSVVLGANFINDMDIFNKYIHVDSWSKYASYESAKELSIVSQEFGKNGNKHFGVGIACSLAANNEREGRVNLANIVVTGYNFEISRTIYLNDIRADNVDEKRLNQEKQIYVVVMEMISTTCKLLVGENDISVSPEYKIKFVETQKIEEDEINIYPGSFNPIHCAHKEIKMLSEGITGKKTYLEISLQNFDKKRINIDDIKTRTDTIGESVILSYNKTFVEKYEWLMRNYKTLTKINFVCGFDTWVRIPEVDREYFKSKGNVKFLVFGRHAKWMPDEEHKKHENILIFHSRLIDYDNKISSSQIRNETR